MYFHTNRESTIHRLSQALLNADQLGRTVRFDVDSEGRLKYKIGEGMWSPPMESDEDPYRG